MGTLTYVYCLVRSARRPVLRGMPRGMAGSRGLRALEAGDDLWLIAASVPARDYGEEALARGLQDLDWVGPRALAHEAVIERFLSTAALLPMQLFTLFTSDERAVAHVAGDRRRIARNLARVAGQVEWGLRLTWNETSARQAFDRARARAKARATGVQYLAHKRDLLDVNRARLRDAKTRADRIYRALARQATEARRRTGLEQVAPGSRLLLDAAFMVPARQSRMFRAGIRRTSAGLKGSGVSVSLTGPWPPYNFIDAR